MSELNDPHGLRGVKRFAPPDEINVDNSEGRNQ